jgi:hypothetical protein
MIDIQPFDGLGDNLFLPEARPDRTDPQDASVSDHCGVKNIAVFDTASQ